MKLNNKIELFFFLSLQFKLVRTHKKEQLSRIQSKLNKTIL